VWDDPDQFKDLLALAAGVVVRDQYPEQFGAVHHALFAARHDQGFDIREAKVVAGVLDAAGVPGDKVLAEVDTGARSRRSGGPTSRRSTSGASSGCRPSWSTGRAVFVRLMSRPQGDAALARRTIEASCG
jgi:2-hydroxychromene-2-carboxylate isomerase